MKLVRPGPDGRGGAGKPGGMVRPELQPELVARCREEHSARPVFLSVEQTEDFYEGFCNNTLWPLFHYFPSVVAYDEKAWASYEEVNRLFCDAVLEVVEPGEPGSGEEGTLTLPMLAAG